MTGDRLAVVAHELRSPVAALAAIAQAAATPRVTAAKRRRLVDLALAAGRNVERLLADASACSVVRRPLDPGRLAVEAAESAALAGAAVRAEVEAPLPLVAGDSGRLRQLLDNLIANATAHSRAGDEVVVSVRAAAGRVLVSVADRGGGIAPRDQVRIFEPGERATEARPGSGLGLALARAIAEAHGGELEVESAPGAGSVFTLSLPSSAGASG